MELNNISNKELLEELEKRLIEYEIEKGIIKVDDTVIGCPKLPMGHLSQSPESSMFLNLKKCQTRCPKYGLCRLRIIKRRRKW